MTIDEQPKNLAERHQALAESLELTASLHRDQDRRTRQAIDALASLHADTERHMVGMMDAITRLANIAAGHDIRLDSLEGRA